MRLSFSRVPSFAGLHKERHSLCDFASIWAHLPDQARYTTAAVTLFTMPRNRSRVTDMFILTARDHTARIQSAHLQLSCAAYALLYVITFRCLSSRCLLFRCLLPVITTCRAHRSPIPAPFCFCPHATRQTRLSAPDCQPTRTAMRRHPVSARFTRPVRAPSAKSAAAFAADTAARHPALPLSAPSIPASGAEECISLRSRFMWNIRLVIRQNLNVYRSFCSFMHIYTPRHYMFFAYAFAFLAPAILSPLPLRG